EIRPLLRLLLLRDGEMPPDSTRRMLGNFPKLSGDMMIIPHDDALAMAVSKAIREGDLQTIAGLMAKQPELKSASIQDQKGGLRTLLHIATDWPGHFPNGAAVVRLLMQHGCDPNARKEGDETPLHWAASSDDVEVIDALLDGGADVEALGAVIAGGT